MGIADPIVWSVSEQRIVGTLSARAVAEGEHVVRSLMREPRDG